MLNWLGRSCFLLYSHGVRTQSLCIASSCVQSWPERHCFLIYHVVIEYRVGTREDISCWYGWLFWSKNNYLWPSFYCMINVFPFWRLFLVTLSSSPSISSIHSKKKSTRVTWRELSAFILFWVYLWVYVYTLVSGIL